MAVKKSVLGRCLALAAATTLGMCVSGCGGRADVQPRSVAIVVQNTSGAPLWSMPKELNEAIAQARETNGVVTVTIADGEPTTEAFDFSGCEDSEVKRNRMQKKLESQLGATADDSGCDMLKAVETGVSSLAGSAGATDLYVISNGLSDCGLLDMTSGLLVESDPEQVAEFYAVKNELADLSRAKKVSWYGMGSTSGDQPRPSNAQAAAVSALWEKVLARCGTSLEVKDETVSAPGEREGAPKVDIVPFPSAQAFDPSQAARTTRVEFTPTQLGFVGDSCEFVDQGQAQAALASVASLLRGDPGLRATVTASSATHPREGYSQRLSEERAEAVKAALVSMSVPEGQVSARGVGSGEPDDIDPATGLQVPEKSAAKRRVTVEIAPM